MIYPFCVFSGSVRDQHSKPLQTQQKMAQSGTGSCRGHCAGVTRAKDIPRTNQG